MSGLRDLREGLAAAAVSRELPRWSGFAGALALVLFAAFAYAPLFGGGMILTGDTLHAWRIFEIGRCLDDGQLPCRWAPDLGNGYGFPLFNYYPPLPYYAGELLHRLGLSYLRAVDMLYVAGLVGAGLSMYALARRLWGDLGGLVSAVAYVYAPYLALDVYMRGALAELWALAIAPALLWAVYELVTTARPRYVPLVALLSGLLLLSHSLVAVIVMPAVALWAAALLVLRGRESVRPALLGAAAALWGLGLAAFFTLPVLAEGSQVQLETLTEPPLDYGSYFVSAGDLFWSRTSDYSALLSTDAGTPVQIGWFHWTLAALALPAGLIFLRTGERRRAIAVGSLAAFFAIGVFMTVSASEFAWDDFGPLRYLQFPWRYMGLVSLASAGLAGAWLALVRGRPLWTQLALAGALAGVLAGTGHTFVQPLYRCQVEAGRAIPCAGSDAEYFSNGPYATRQFASVRDYLPEAVDEIPAEPPAAVANVIKGEASISAPAASSNTLDFEIDARSDARVQAAVFDYPNWRVRVDGELVEHAASEPNGLITFNVPEGSHSVELRLENTGVRRAGNAISLVSWSALLLVVPAMMVAARLRGSDGT